MQDINILLKRRRIQRIALTMPVRVEGKKSPGAPWNEVTRFQTVSPFGAGFAIRVPVAIGQLVQLTAPLPQKLRRFDYSEQQYRVWGLVRYCNPGNSAYEIGVAFLGKHAPASYHEDSTAIYELVGFDENGLTKLGDGRDVPAELTPEPARRHPRYPIPVEIYLETLDSNQKATDYEITVSENLSVGGAAVFASIEVAVGDLVRVNFMAFNVSILARVRNRRIGQDGMPRLHLEFIDKQLTLEGIE
jgi:hypothetical protein